MNKEDIIKLKISVYEKNSEVCYYITDENGYGQEYTKASLEWIQKQLIFIMQCKESIEGKTLLP